ncbi:MAG: RelA/SpoT domain-containing protein, partial [Planctomycetes bacterium]|nr:RelA/SpoT domain-containing protein [Planctomycetota bacterium]
ARVRVDDYITQPRESGYRGVHLIYKYFSDKKVGHNGLLVEIQLRSQLQHAWATAVETVGTFLKQALKSSRGHRDWLRFFSLMGSAIALREARPVVRGTPTSHVALVSELKTISSRLDVEARLEAYAASMKTVEQGQVSGARYFLLVLDPAMRTVAISSYRGSELSAATTRYSEVEAELKAMPGREAVLVSVESIAALRRAYPNYFLDTGAFLAAFRAAIA